MAAMGAIYNYVTELSDRKEREPGDDLISRLMTEYVATGQLNRATVGHERRDPAAGRPRDHGQHDRAWERWRCWSTPINSPDCARPTIRP